MSEDQTKDAEYYRICAAEMMTKAQAAPSKGIKRAYLNLALNWARKAVESSEAKAVAPPTVGRASAPGVPQKN